jgi:hypothetical protein
MFPSQQTLYRTILRRIRTKIVGDLYGDRFRELFERMANVEIAFDTFLESPRWEDSEASGFNGQAQRKGIFLELLSLNFSSIVETGTWVGHTTGWMSTRSKLPVHSCEVSQRYHKLAALRLSDLKGIHLFQGDSRVFLQTMATSKVTLGRPLFYLDAHWKEDLPLREEIDIIAREWKEFAILIDDFEVPGDSGYGFDDYGPGKRLNLELVQQSEYGGRLKAFFPSLPSSKESGAKRGCVVLIPEGPIAAQVEKFKTLKLHRS